MLIFKRSNDLVVIDWDASDPNDMMLSETMAATARGYDGSGIATAIRNASERGVSDVVSENALFLALWPKQQEVQLRK